jgi:hypothetical protein
MGFTTHAGHVMPGHIHATHIMTFLSRSGILPQGKSRDYK